MQIPLSKLETGRGRLIGIGRVKIPKTSDFDYEIPLLSFVVVEKTAGGYISSCIHLQIDGYGENVEDSRQDMLDNILYFLDKNFNSDDYKEHCWENLLDLFEANENSSALWNQYHAVQIISAERGHTTDHQCSQSQRIKELWKRIEALESRVKELEEQIRSPEGQSCCKVNKFIDTLKATGKMPIVQYISTCGGAI